MRGLFLSHTAVKTPPPPPPPLPVGINLEMMDDQTFGEVAPDGVIFWLISQNDV